MNISLGYQKERVCLFKNKVVIIVGLSQYQEGVQLNSI